MLPFLLSLLGPLGDFIVKIIKGMGPPAEVVEAEKAGSAVQALQDVEKNDAQVSKGFAAATATERAVDSPGGLRQYEQTDPNNRDNHQP